MGPEHFVALAVAVAQVVLSAAIIGGWAFIIIGVCVEASAMDAAKRKRLP